MVASIGRVKRCLYYILADRLGSYAKKKKVKMCKQFYVTKHIFTNFALSKGAAAVVVAPKFSANLTLLL